MTYTTEQSTYRPHSYNTVFDISYGNLLNTYTMNYYSLDIDNMRIGGQINPVGSTIFQCRAIAHLVEIVARLYSTVLINFK